MFFSKHGNDAEVEDAEKRRQEAAEKKAGEFSKKLDALTSADITKLAGMEVKLPPSRVVTPFETRVR